MILAEIESRFNEFLSKHWSLDNLKPFICVYICLLMVCKESLTNEWARALEERKKQLAWMDYDAQAIDMIRSVVIDSFEREFKDPIIDEKERAFNRLMYCALSDNREEDFFYLTEPMFEAIRLLSVSNRLVQSILEAEFEGFSQFVD